MSGFTVFAVVVVMLAVLGLVFQKNGEMAGLSPRARRGGLRSPHGRLVRTKRLDTFEDLPFRSKFGRVAAVLFIVTAVILVLSVVDVFDLAGTVPVSLDVLAVLVAACCLTQADAGLARPFAYTLAGYLVLAAVATFAGLYVLPAFMPIDVGGINALSMVFGTLGAALSVAAMPLMRTYAREFEDGHVNTIQVTAASAAARAYDKLADSAWKPPADRVSEAGAEGGLRARMKKRDERR